MSLMKFNLIGPHEPKVSTVHSFNEFFTCFYESWNYKGLLCFNKQLYWHFFVYVDLNQKLLPRRKRKERKCSEKNHRLKIYNISLKVWIFFSNLSHLKEILKDFEHMAGQFYCTKGQLISKGNFGVFNSSKKRIWKFQFLP